MNNPSYKALIPEVVWELVYGSQRKAVPYLHGPDSMTRHIALSRELFSLLDIDFHRWPRVTVAGSKGKGSTAVLLASILQASGERVGLISSPELRNFNERIRVDGQCVSSETLIAAAQRIAPAVRSIASRLVPPRYLGPGGVILALGATIFAEANISVLVVEAGRGGEYDEARLVEATLSVLTPIMREHADKLGPTVPDIARTKTYITAPGSPIITAPQTAEVQAVIRSVGAELSSPIVSVDTEVSIEHVASDLQGVRGDLRFQEHVYAGLRVSLPGRHQLENAATALLAASRLTHFGTKFTDEGALQGTGRVRWAGRAQLLQRQPWVLLDGAINREAAAVICTLLQNVSLKRLTAIVCVPEPKDLAGLCTQIAPLVEKIIVTEVPLPYLTWYKDAAAIAARYCASVEKIVPAELAFQQALSTAERDEGFLLLGTQSFLSVALHYWNIDTCNAW